MRTALAAALFGALSSFPCLSLAQSAPMEPVSEPAGQPAEDDPQSPLPKPDVDDRYQPTPPSRVSPVIPQLEALDIPKPGGKTAAEGSFLVRHLGAMHLIETGDLVFAPAVEPGEQKSPVFLVSPSSESDRLRAQIDPQRHLWTGRISGEVFMYRGRNILVVSAFSPEPLDLPAVVQPQEPAEATPTESETPPTPPTDQPADRPADQPAADSILDPRVSELEAELLAENRAPRALDQAMNDPVPSAQEPAVAPAPTGTRIIRRRARMVRDTQGQWQIRFDQDGENREPPLTVVPCQLLELMEREASRRGDSWTFHISGRVIASRQGGYIVPTLFISERPSDIVPRQ